MVLLGYKMRTQITKSLQTRCKTIRRALTAYNAAAASLNPPRPPLDWSRVSNFSFLDEFTLLQDCRNDIRGKPWTKPAVREAMKARHRIARAREEITRLNVEVRRLRTAIRDETLLFDHVLTKLKRDDDPLLGAVEEFTSRRKKVNSHLLSRVYQIHALPGFSGVKMPGRRVGGVVLPHVDVPNVGDGETPSHTLKNTNTNHLTLRGR